MGSLAKLGALSAFALIGVGVANAGALSLEGSDTLETVTKLAIQGGGACGANLIATLQYAGGGSTKGELGLRNGTQQIAPMSRFLTTANTCAGPNPAQSHGYAFALDGLAIVQSRREGAPNQCDTNGDSIFTDACPAGDKAVYGSKDRQNIDQQCVGLANSTPTSNRFANVKEKNSVAGLQCPGCTNEDADAALEYKLGDWKDVLAVLFAGKHHEGTVDCNSDVRRTLADEWATITRASCASQRCTKVSHMWRRDDLSGTTDTFKSLVGISNFCNGNTLQDNDPIRRPCTANEQVCQADGTLGFVLPISVAEGLASNVLYRSNACQPGNFAVCAADGQTLPRDATNTFGCLNSATNNPPATSGDGRRFNLVTRAANCTVINDALGVPQTASFNRIHSSTTEVLAGDAVACKRDSATLQIGCLVEAAPCSLGFAGLQALTVSGATNLKVNGNRPTKANVRKLITDPTSSLLYPLARKLYLNTMVGFNNVTNVNLEDTLADRFADRACADQATLGAGYITLDDTQTMPVVCEDFNEQTFCGAASNANNCPP